MTDPNEYQCLDERFDRAWGTVDEIFAPSPTDFSAFGGYNVKSDLRTLLSHPDERIDQEPRQQLGYDWLKRVVDELARVNKPAEIQRLVSLVSRALETDFNYNDWKRYYPETYKKAIVIPNKFLDYAGVFCPELKSSDF